MATNRFQDFQKLIEAAEVDFEKFYDKSISAAGTRVRKHMQELTNLCKEIRKDVTEVKNDRKETK